VRPLDGSGGTRREDSPLYVLDAEPSDHCRSRIPRRADHRDPRISSRQNASTGLSGMPVSGGVRRATRTSGRPRSGRPLLPVCAGRSDHHRLGEGQCRRPSEGGVGLHHHRLGPIRLYILAHAIGRGCGSPASELRCPKCRYVLPEDEGAHSSGFRRRSLTTLFPGASTYDDTILPWTTFTQPEVGRIGLSEAEAQASGITYDVYRSAFADND
jgi:hypothetical protein